MKTGPDLDEFWSRYLNSEERNILFILGLGFDPRMTYGYSKLLSYGGSGARNCLMIEYDEGIDSPSYRHRNLIIKNREKIKNLKPNNGKLINKSFKKNQSSSSSALSLIQRGDLVGYDDIIIDISALPRSIYFQTIGRVLGLTKTQTGETKQNCPNVHVFVSENATLDSKIIDEEPAEDAEYLRGFASDLDSESTAHLPKIWIPLLGENHLGQLRTILAKVNPIEISPLLPFPSARPRRADDLLLEYKEFLFDGLMLNKNNFIYASERNPFQVYRMIYQTIRQYEKTLKLLGGCRFAISASSSKLISIGAMLAAYELNSSGVGLIHVGAQGYTIQDEDRLEEHLNETQLFSLWLSGECYE